MSQHDEELKELVRQAREPDTQDVPSFASMTSPQPAKNNRWQPVLAFAALAALLAGIWVFSAQNSSEPTEPMPDIVQAEPEPLPALAEATDWELAESPTAFLSETPGLDPFDTPTDFLAVDDDDFEEL